MKRVRASARVKAAQPELAWLDVAAVRRAKGAARARDAAATTDAERAALQRRNSWLTAGAKVREVASRFARRLT